MDSAASFEERFFARVDQSGDCWVWTAGRTVRGSAGYGVALNRDGKSTVAHRIAYELLVGPIPNGLTLDHECRNRQCVNPAHLTPMTMRENVLRGIGPTAINAKKTHCPRGHPLEGENVYRYPDGRRDCRTCQRERNARYRLQKGQKVRVFKKAGGD